MNLKIKVVLKVLAIFVATIVFTYFTFEWFGTVYINFFKPVGSWGFGSELAVIAGLPAAYVFFLLLMLPITVPKLSKWIYGLLLLPVIIFEFSFDLLHFYFPFIFAVIGWGIAKGILYFKSK